jgi:polyisoprenoid-binding protein YceI
MISVILSSLPHHLNPTSAPVLLHRSQNKTIMKVMIRRFAFILCCIAGYHIAFAQSQSGYRTDNSNAGNIKLSGTSTMHKWDMNSKTFSGEAQFVFDPLNTSLLSAIPSLTFSIAVVNLRSDDKSLDKNAYKALKAQHFKYIVYKLKSATVHKGSGNSYMLKTRGDLSIAGVTKEISMDVRCVINKDETISCTGTEKLKMTDYGVKPPTFMLGAMKTGDNISLDFTIVYNK